MPYEKLILFDIPAIMNIFKRFYVDSNYTFPITLDSPVNARFPGAIDKEVCDTQSRVIHNVKIQYYEHIQIYKSKEYIYLFRKVSFLCVAAAENIIQINLMNFFSIDEDRFHLLTI